MKQGDTGVNVRKVQNYLNRWVRSRDIVEADLVEDGDYGIHTTNRVRLFQSWAHLESSGRVDPITVATLTALVVADDPTG